MATNQDKALEIIQKFRQLENENRSLRSVLVKYWKYEGDPEIFVQKGIQQLQARENEDRETERLEKRFPSSTDCDALLQSLHEEVLGRMDV